MTRKEIITVREASMNLAYKWARENDPVADVFLSDHFLSRVVARVKNEDAFFVLLLKCVKHTLKNLEKFTEKHIMYRCGDDTIILMVQKPKNGRRMITLLTYYPFNKTESRAEKGKLKTNVDHVFTMKTD